MAKLSGPLSFSGSLADLTFYERKDLEGTFARTKSSLTKERIYSDPAFANTLRHFTEYGGCSKAAKLIRRVLYPLDPVRIGNWQAPVTQALTNVQDHDTQGVYGQRSVLFSRHGRLLEGLCLSSRTPFEQLLRTPLSHTLSKEALQAQVSFPEVVADVNFIAPATAAYFRMVAVLGVVPDLLYTEQGYKPDGDYSQLFPQEALSDWFPVKGGAPANTLQVQLTYQPPNDAFGLLLAAGILMGSVNRWGKIEPVTYSGSGRIVAVR